jgi:hypothetical protein
MTELEFTTTTIDIRPSRWRHPILRLNWWWMDKREIKRRKKLSPLEREVEDQLRRGIEHAFLFGEDKVDIETIKITDPERDAKQKAKLYGEWPPDTDYPQDY